MSDSRDTSILNRVAAATAEIIAEKEQRHVGPLRATQWEIIERMAGASSADILEAMRELHHQRRFRAHLDINKNPSLMKP